jgi:GTP cyclohydrolase IA
MMKKQTRQPREPQIEALVRKLLVALGEDPTREGLLRTPARVAKSLLFLTGGTRSSLSAVINNAVFESHANNMIIVRDIEVYSLCEHHLLPFFGRCHVGYIARTRLLGASKIARIVDHYARRLQIQERLTEQVAREVRDTVDAEGVGVVIECRHLCMMMRGVAKQNSVMTTSSVLGSFHDDAATRAEFLSLIARHPPAV